ncbi:hypothetical protein SAMN05421644_10123 [Allochromatium warmingii]|uniref:Uncharacterized protein n=1 Tax=Allochromatium warmingii TaxID=61595 RepID=A0A1H3AKW5_ALLWA|nr:hypothetical protein SAMN05421644_10123 [Allochromatium warmingii]
MVPTTRPNRYAGWMVCRWEQMDSKSKIKGYAVHTPLKLSWPLIANHSPLL